MNFSTDRDLLLLEPHVFIDIPLPTQERVRTSDGNITGTTLTSASADFVGAQVEVGSVVLVDGVGLEVIARTNATTLTVSKLRAIQTDPAIAPGDETAAEVTVRTFSPQATLVHDQLLRMLDIDPDEEDAAEREAGILSKQLMRKLEALGTLERIYATAAGILGNNREICRKAAEYHQRFFRAVRESHVRLDTNGDGIADEIRDLSVTHLMRM